MVIYIAGLGITHVDFAIFRVVGEIEIVGGVDGVKEIAFKIFRVLESVQVPATAA